MFQIGESQALLAIKIPSKTFKTYTAGPLNVGSALEDPTNCRLIGTIPSAVSLLSMPRSVSLSFI